jgi:MOSC domain-containing protein YiiM/uncharacterized metal-binding protein
MSKPAQLSPESASSVLSPPEAQSAAQNVPTGISPSQPLIYACSGCSSAAQLTNHLALRMDREGHAEMSCIVGLGGDVKSLVRLAKSGRAIVMLDGCALHCGKHTLARHALSPTLHWDLSRMGVRKQKHIDFDTTDATRLEPSLAQAIKIAGADSASLAAVQRATISEVTEPENVGPRAVVHAVLVGKAVTFTRPGSLSAINKRSVTGALRVGLLGLEGDEQGDRRVHGGPDKAIHAYPSEHYGKWREELGALPILREPGAFGENLCTAGLVERDVCLGDRYRVGGALLEISQSRQPCWKLNDRFGVPDMARRMQAMRRTGWYFRVLKEGEVAAGDKFTLADRPHPDWPLLRLIELLYERMLDRDSLTAALALPLVPGWRKLIERRLASGTVEDWSPRIDGPSSAAV